MKTFIVKFVTTVLVWGLYVAALCATSHYGMNPVLGGIFGFFAACAFSETIWRYEL